MRAILCYGDSNTWGYDPAAFNFETGEFRRHPYEVRWPVRLAALLGPGYHIAEEGYNGRTTVFDDPIRPGRNALDHFPVSFLTHEPLDLITLMLGTNDLKDVYNVPANVIAGGVERLIRELHYLIPTSLSRDVKILLISPPEVLPMENGEFYPTLSAASHEKSKQLPALYGKVAAKYGCGFLDAAKIVAPSRVDGIHLDPAAHAALAEAVAIKVREMLPA